MSPEDVKNHIQQGIPGSEVTVSGEGCNLSVVVVSNSFEGKTMVAEQKMVYATVNDYIASGELHALAIKAYTPEEGKAEQS